MFKSVHFNTFWLNLGCCSAASQQANNMYRSSIARVYQADYTHTFRFNESTNQYFCLYVNLPWKNTSIATDVKKTQKVTTCEMIPATLATILGPASSPRKIPDPPLSPCINCLIYLLT